MSQTLHERMTAAAGRLSFRELGDLTGTHPETVRRYMQGQAPSVEFLTRLCAERAISATWLLTGRGPMHQNDVRSEALREADTSELLGAMAESLEALLARVERLELFVHTLEARVRAARSGRESA